MASSQARNKISEQMVKLNKAIKAAGGMTDAQHKRAVSLMARYKKAIAAEKQARTTKASPKKTAQVKPRGKATTPAAAKAKVRGGSTTTKKTTKKTAPKTAPKRKVTKKVVSGTRTYDSKTGYYKYSGKTQAEKDAVKKAASSMDKAGKRIQLRAAGYKGEELKKRLDSWMKNYSPTAQAKRRRAARKPTKTTQYKKPIGPKRAGKSSPAAARKKKKY